MTPMMSRVYAAKYIGNLDKQDEERQKRIHSQRMRLIGELMRITREGLNISLRKFARRIGVSPAYLSDMERGKRMYSHMDAAVRVLKAEIEKSKGCYEI